METENVNISDEGKNACTRVETKMAALDSAIDARENKIKESGTPQEKSNLKAAEAQRAAWQSTLQLGSAQQNARDHVDTFSQSVAQSKDSKNYKHAKIDRFYDRKYTDPLNKKLEYANAIGVGEIKVGNLKFDKPNDLGAAAKEDIKVAKSCASLIAEGVNNLDVPKSQAKPEGAPGAEWRAAAE
jgi:hypothetical protein